jgi:hypothetical protein
MINEIVYPACAAKTLEYSHRMEEDFKNSKQILKTEFPVGAVVMIQNQERRKKADERYIGPFTVKRTG